jgi:hypothetical protein
VNEHVNALIDCVEIRHPQSEQVLAKAHHIPALAGLLLDT